MDKIFRITLLTFMTLLVSVSLVCAETGTVVDDLWRLTQEQGQNFHNRFLAFERADQAGQRRIESAVRQLRSAKTANTQTYCRLDYSEQRALHIKTMAREVIGLLNDNDQFVNATSRAKKNHSMFIQSDQLIGMRTLLTLIINEEQRGAVESKTLVEDASSHILTLALTHLVTPPAFMSEELTRSLSSYRKDLKHCLEGFRKEIDYLDRQMQTI